MPPQNQPAPIVPTSSQSSPAIFAVVITILLAVIAVGAAHYLGYISLAMQPGTPAIQEKMDATNVPAAKPESISLKTGTFALIGRGAGQSGNYAGTVTITNRPSTKNVYDLVWSVTSGQVQMGVAILADNVLSVSYYEKLQDATIQDIGVVAYRLVDDSHLEGEWTSVQGGTAGVEQLTWQPPL